LLHTRHDVTVRAEPYAHTQVPESLADDFWVDAKSQRMGGVAAAQVVNANARNSSDLIGFANPAVHRFQREEGTGTYYFVLRKKPAWRCRTDHRYGRGRANPGCPFCIALLGLVGSWWFVRPPGLSRIGYSQNLAETELTRQIVADDLANHDGFRFFTTRVMSPDGINAEYFPWSLERDW